MAYAPEIRGFAGITRRADTGQFQTMQGAREEICLMVQIETREALEQLEAIAQVPGVDAVFIGPADPQPAWAFLENPAILRSKSMLGGNEGFGLLQTSGFNVDQGFKRSSQLLSVPAVDTNAILRQVRLLSLRNGNP